MISKDIKSILTQLMNGAIRCAITPYKIDRGGCMVSVRFIRAKKTVGN